MIGTARTRLAKTPTPPVCLAVLTARIEYVEGAGHPLFVDQTDRFNAILEQFIGKLGTR